MLIYEPSDSLTKKIKEEYAVEWRASGRNRGPPVVIVQMNRPMTPPRQSSPSRPMTPPMPMTPTRPMTPQRPISPIHDDFMQIRHPPSRSSSPLSFPSPPSLARLHQNLRIRNRGVPIVRAEFREVPANMNIV